MELEELKNQWEKMSNEIENQKILTDKLIKNMTQEKYKNRLQKIVLPEFIATIFCFIIVFLIVFNFEKLNTWYLQFSGAFTVLFLIILPILSLKSIFGLQKIKISTTDYKQALMNFAMNKKRFILIQKWSFYLSFVLVLVCLPVANKLMNGKDIFFDSTIWLWYLPFGFIFLFIFSKWVFKKYSNGINSAEKLLKEIEAS